MANLTDIVKKQLVYWGRVNAAAGAGATVDYAEQHGPGLLTGPMAASIYTITMPANFTIPLAGRFVALTPIGAAGAVVAYNHAGSAANTVIVNGWTGAGAAGDCAFYFEIYRIERLP